MACCHAWRAQLAVVVRRWQLLDAAQALDALGAHAARQRLKAAAAEHCRRQLLTKALLGLMMEVEQVGSPGAPPCCPCSHPGPCTAPKACVLRRAPAC